MYSFFIYTLRFEVHYKCTFSTVEYTSFSQEKFRSMIRYQEEVSGLPAFTRDLHQGALLDKNLQNTQVPEAR